MNVWRLMVSHVPGPRVADWSQREGVIAIGHGGTGDLRNCNFRNADDLRQLVSAADPGRSVGGCSNDGRSMWRLYDEIKVGDLIILNTDKRFLTMRVTGDYYYVPNEFPPYYEHRRNAEAVPIDPNILWGAAGRAAPGQGIYAAIIRCSNQLTDAGYNALVV
jgi:predicted Mrr-cat superfamily restriction endonuclease